MPDPTSPTYWLEEDELLVTILQPIIVQAATRAARRAFDDLMIQVGGELGVSWDVVNEAAIEWAQGYTFELVKGINGTSQAFLQDEIAKWIESGEPLDALVDTLGQMWGPVRAEMIGVTEITRIFAQSNFEVWGASGVVPAYRFNTVFDNDVCEICEPDHMHVFPLDDDEHKPPRHVRCRCYPTPANVGE